MHPPLAQASYFSESADMKKASYRLLQWTMVLGTLATMATACVVTSDDSDDDDNSAGESGSSTTAGKSSTDGGEGGTSTIGGKTAGGTSAGGKASGGTSAGGGSAGTTSGGTGGSGSGYVPGLCEVDEPTATMLPSCDPSANDEGQTCKICLKSKCCEAWQTCYGDTPTTACGWGATEDAPGQFDCIQNCFLDTPNGSDDLEATLTTCEGKCLNQCADKDDGFALTDTQGLLECAQDKCLDACFPAQ